MNTTQQKKAQPKTPQKRHIVAAGLAATFVGIISYIPVVYLVYKTKHTKNFPVKALLLAIMSNTLWIYYAVAKEPETDTQVALMGVLYFCIYSFILYTKLTN